MQFKVDQAVICGERTANPRFSHNPMASALLVSIIFAVFACRAEGSITIFRGAKFSKGKYYSTCPLNHCDFWVKF